MIFVDANLLLYAYDSQSRFHERARAWFEAVCSGLEPVGLPWTAILAFSRILTDTRVQTRPWTIDEVRETVNDWAEHPNITFVNPGPRHWEVLQTILLHAQVRGSVVTDAHLAALAIEHGATLATNDRDFTRFDGLRVIYPLAD